MLIFIPQTALETVSDENRPKFFKANFIPFLKNFTYSWAELNVVYVFKKSRPKS